jgi:Tfp pilus assembly protein PilE
VKQRGTSYLEVLVVVAVIAVLAGAVIVPGYRSYTLSRAPADAAARLAEDLALLERTAQNGTRNEGSSLIIVSANPLVYRGYRGRPASVDPNSSLRALLIERRFANVALALGPIGTSSPLLFASNGSAQYVSGGVIMIQHAVVEFALAGTSGGRTTKVDLDLFTGSISLP